MCRAAPEDGDENQVPEASEDDVNEPGAWEEDFKSHHDSKPNGPEAVAMDFSFPQAQVLFGMYIVHREQTWIVIVFAFILIRIIKMQSN